MKIKSAINSVIMENMDDLLMKNMCSINSEKTRYGQDQQ